MPTGLTDPAMQIRRAVKPVLAALAGGTPNVGRDDVDDLEAAVVEKVLGRLKKGDTIVDLDAYAKQTARRTFYDLVRRLGRVRLEVLEDDPDDSAGNTELRKAMAGLLAPASPSEQVIAGEDARRHARVIDHALDQLSAADRAVLLLRYGEGLDGQQVAERLGYKSAAVVATMAGRARATLEAHLSPSLAGWARGR